MTDSQGRLLLTGSVLFDGWAPEPGALVRVEILDVTYVDAASTSIAAEDLRFELGGLHEEGKPEETATMPITLPFALRCGELDARAEYIVAATVMAAGTGEVIGRTMAAHPVLTFGYPTSDVEVRVSCSEHPD